MKKAAETWDKEWWKNGGGGAVWDGFAYDADAGLVYVGTGNAQPWTYLHRSSLGKDNLYAASILAVDIETGELKLALPGRARRQLGLRQRPASDPRRPDDRRTSRAR